jgi:cobalt ECF transporter T component CbiQ
MLVIAGSLSLGAKIPLRSLAVRLAGPLTFVFLASVALLFLVPGDTVATVGPLGITDGGLVRFGSALGRALVALTGAVVLVSTTRFPELVHALRLLRLPRAVTTALGLAYRLLYVTLDESERIRRAARSRNAGQGAATRRQLLASIVAAVIQRSLVRSERTHQAMLARGFRGDLVSLHPSSVDARSLALLCVLVLIVFCVTASAYLSS